MALGHRSVQSAVYGDQSTDSTHQRDFLLYTPTQGQLTLFLPLGTLPLIPPLLSAPLSAVQTRSRHASCGSGRIQLFFEAIWDGAEQPSLDRLARVTRRSTDTISSSYRRGKQQDVRARGGARAEQSKVKPEGTCTYCGEAGHGKTPQWRARRAECPAYGKTCRKCNRQNHLDKVCLGGRSSRPAPEETDGVCDEQQATACGELCTLTSTADMSVTWDRVREAMSSSDDMRTLEEMAADSFPESRAGMPVAIRGFHQYREDITSADGVVLYKDRCNAAAAWSCERPGEARDGVRARSTTGTATCRLSPARDAAHPYRASGAGPGRPSYATAGLCGPYGPSPTATRCAAGDGLAPVHQEGRCACLA
ncbi:unnamed protein product [Arctogadus glacialis]